MQGKLRPVGKRRPAATCIKVVVTLGTLYLLAHSID